MPPRKSPRVDRKPKAQRPPVSVVPPSKDEFVDDGPVSSIDPAIIADAGELLKKGGYHPLLMASDAETRLQWLSEHVADRRKISRKQHLEQIVQAYALFALSREEPAIKETIVRLALDRRIAVNARTSELRLCVEAFISYGTEEDEARRANHSYSRDVAALKTLIRRGVLPTQVIALGSRAGEGLDAWARANAKRRQHERATEIDTTADNEDTPTHVPGKSRSKQASPVPEPEVNPTVHLRMSPLPQKLTWIVRSRNGDTMVRELEFSGSREAEEILTRCCSDLIRLESALPQQAPRRSVMKRKPATLKIDPQKLRTASRKTSAR